MNEVLTPTTELEAVNLMLAVVGESPISTLEDSGIIDAVMAQQILLHASRQTQLIGWHWNTEENYPLAATYPEGEIMIPVNTLKVDTAGVDQGLDLVQRGNRLYDRKNHTFIIGKTVRVRITLFLPFDHLPETARSFITIRAARIFQERMVGSDNLWSFNKQDEVRSWADLQAAEADTQNFNILTGNAEAVEFNDRIIRG